MADFDFTDFLSPADRARARAEANQQRQDADRFRFFDPSQVQQPGAQDRNVMQPDWLQWRKFEAQPGPQPINGMSLGEILGEQRPYGDIFPQQQQAPQPQPRPQQLVQQPPPSIFAQAAPSKRSPYAPPSLAAILAKFNNRA